MSVAVNKCVPLLLAVLACMPASALAQATDAERDAEIARLRQTVEVLVKRLDALEAERASPAASAPATAATPPSALPAVPGPVIAAPASSTAQAQAMPLPEPSPLPVHPSFDEDELAGARVDNELPPGEEGLEGFFQVAPSTWLRLGGYAKLDAMYDSDDAGFSDQFITSTIPVGAQSGSGSFNMHARQTRFTLEGRRLTERGWLRFMLQNDFFGSGGYRYNLRHAWGQLGNTYAGYGWSAFMDLDAGPDTLDFAGPGVVPFGRVTSIRQYFPLKSGNQMVLAAEHAAPEITSAVAGDDARTTAPNLVFAMRHEGGSGHVQAGVMLRQIAYSGDDRRDEAFAGGVSLSGSLAADYGGYLTWGALGGRGIAAYVGDLLGMGLDGVVDGSGSLQALDEWGGWVGYGHPWSADWRSTVTWGRLHLERNALLSPSAFRRSDYVAANLIYAPAPSWSWGMEVLYGRLEEQAGADGDVFRFQTSLKYDFFR